MGVSFVPVEGMGLLKLESVCPPLTSSNTLGPHPLHLLKHTLTPPPHLLKHTLAESQLLLQALASVLQVHTHQRLLLQLLLGHSMTIFCLGETGQ